MKGKKKPNLFSWQNVNSITVRLRGQIYEGSILLSLFVFDNFGDKSPTKMTVPKDLFARWS